MFNCIEATNKFVNNGFDVLICVYKSEKDLKLMKEISKMYKWSEIHFFKLNLFNKLFYSLVLNHILDKFTKVDYCFFGLITGYNIHAINKINAKNNILIDDGNEILLIVSNINKSYYSKKFKVKTLNKLLRRNFDLDFIKNLKIFSFFDMNEMPMHNILIKNDYLEFRKMIKNIPCSNDVFFIGSNLINTYISKEYFEVVLINTLKEFKDSNIIYIPHRYEDLVYLNELSIRYNFKIKKFSSILELGILEHRKKPKKLISIRSTALETLSFLYDIKFKYIIKLDLDKLLKQEHKKEFLNLYKSYESKGVDIIKVEND